MRYAVAILSSCVVFIAATVFCWRTHVGFRAEFEQWVRDANTSGQLPAEFKNVEPTSLVPSQVGYELPGYWRLRIDFTDALYRWRYFEFILMTAAFVGIAYYRRPTQIGTNRLYPGDLSVTAQ